MTQSAAQTLSAVTRGLRHNNGAWLKPGMLVTMPMMAGVVGGLLVLTSGTMFGGQSEASNVVIPDRAAAP